jgi:hypothetical protein
MRIITHFGLFMVDERETTEMLLAELNGIRGIKRSASHVLSLTCAIHMHLMG